ncbi:hypothetical protein HYC85_019543 [Camellia sinensis]|uniref:Uncharacterized protein n=1 Tax=Camellia sinensis TaxID=4442 RepID=A0A7J7GPR7_CAMSI|nr:hypothetical protein HYC85_019543 [Camellia sinensis]
MMNLGDLEVGLDKVIQTSLHERLSMLTVGGRDGASVLLYLMAITTQWISGRNYDGGHLVVKVYLHSHNSISFNQILKIHVQKNPELSLLLVCKFLFWFTFLFFLTF